MVKCLFLEQSRFTALVQRTSNFGKTQSTFLTSDKLAYDVLNSLQ